MIFTTLFPKNTLRRIIFSKVYRTLRLQSAKNPYFNIGNFFDSTNRDYHARFAGKKIDCNVCGNASSIMYDFPNVRHRTEHRIGLLRETLQCSHCGATMRDRTLAYALLSLINRGKNLPVRSIAELGKQDQLGARCLDTDSFSQTSRLLKHLPDHVRSSFVTNVSFGTELEANRYNINLEKIDFPDESFDIVLTSDVAEHIRDIDRAHREIYRILRKGGTYIFTAPYDPECATHHVLVDTTTSEDKYLVPAQLHGDPLTGGILAYRVFGRQIFVDLEKIGFTVEFLAVNDTSLGIFDGDVFIATRKES